MYKMKWWIQRLKTTLTVLGCFQSIKLLEFLVSLKEAFDAIWKSDAVAVRALMFFLSDDTR